MLLDSFVVCSAQERSWVDLAVHNFGAPINTMWAEGELSFAADGTMVYCSARQDMAVAPGDPKDLYIATFNSETGSWNQPLNMGFPVNAAPATDVDPLGLGMIGSPGSRLMEILSILNLTDWLPQTQIMQLIFL